MLQLYANIKSRRKALKMSQTDLAQKTGYADKSMIARIEAGKIDLPQSKIMLFADALDIAPGDLMGWDEPAEEIISPNESTLLNLYRELNDEGQEKATDYVEDLVWSGRYKKHSEHGMVAQA